jgi:hypothetical protein
MFTSSSQNSPREVQREWKSKNLPDAKNQALIDLVATQSQRLSEVKRDMDVMREQNARFSTITHKNIK